MLQGYRLLQEPCCCIVYRVETSFVPVPAPGSGSEFARPKACIWKASSCSTLVACWDDCCQCVQDWMLLRSALFLDAEAEWKSMRSICFSLQSRQWHGLSGRSLCLVGILLCKGVSSNTICNLWEEKEPGYNQLWERAEGLWWPLFSFIPLAG